MNIGYHTHVLRLYLGLDKPNRQTTPAENALICKYVKNAGKLVEIGVFEAGTTLEIATNTQGTIYAIDPFFPKKFGYRPMPIVVKRMAKRAGANNINFIFKKGQDAVNDVPDGIDFILIDGDHSWKGIDTDFTCWYPKVRDGGILAFHDTVLHEGRVCNIASFDYFEKELKPNPGLELLETADSVSIFRKKPKAK